MNSSPFPSDPTAEEAGVRNLQVVSPTAGAEANRPLTKKVVDPRMNSAEHILTATLMAMFHCGRPFTTHLEPKKSKADYRFARGLTPAEVQEIERRVNAVVATNLPVWEEFLPRAEAAKLHDLHRLPDAAADTIRIVHIGEYDACPCSGKHVPTTNGIGIFRIVSTTHEEGALRVRFKLDTRRDDPAPTT
jgi:misacylated tRNA(Ala) deacylase